MTTKQLALLVTTKRECKNCFFFIKGKCDNKECKYRNTAKK